MVFLIPLARLIMADALSCKSYCNNYLASKAQPLQDDLTFTEHPIHVLDRAERRSRLRAIKFLKGSVVKSF